MSEAGRILGVSHRTAARLLRNEQAFCGGEGLQSLTTALNRPDLYRAILEAASGLSDRERGLSIYPPAVMSLTLDLQSRYETVKTRMRLEDFAKFFGDHAGAVKNAVLCANEGLAQLHAPLVANAIRENLQSIDWTAAMPDIAPAVQQRARELGRIINDLREFFPSREAIATELRVHSGTLHTAIQCRGGENTLADILERARTLLAAKRNSSTSKPATAEAHLPPKSSGLTRLLAHGGETSPLGVPFVFGPQSGDVEFEVTQGFVNFLRWQIQVTRALMNVAAKNKRPEARKAVREVLGKEVEELYLTIQAFTAEFPNRLTTLLQAQREAWAELQPGKIPGKGGDRS